MTLRKRFNSLRLPHFSHLVNHLPAAVLQALALLCFTRSIRMIIVMIILHHTIIIFMLAVMSALTQVQHVPCGRVIFFSGGGGGILI